MTNSNMKSSIILFSLILLILNSNKIFCQESNIGLGFSLNILRPAYYFNSSKNETESSISYSLVTSDFGIFYGQEIFKNVFIQTKLGSFKESYRFINPNRADASTSTPGHDENCDHYTSTDKFIYASIKIKYHLKFVYKNLYLSGSARKSILTKELTEVRFINNGSLTLDGSHEEKTYDFDIPLDFQIGIGNQFKIFNIFDFYIEPNILIGNRVKNRFKFDKIFRLINLELGIII